MSAIVLKFGGTSVGTPERVKLVAERIVRQRAEGHDVVVVVSAMGDTTDELLALAEKVVSEPRKKHPRELDMLLTSGERIAMALVAMAVRELGSEAISLTGSQAAIITDNTHTGARIEEVKADRVREELKQGKVVIVAGFQGVSRLREVTTLGRGGSDTTAVALAAALAAERCDIYTDVDGIYTADPRKVKDARRIHRIDFTEMVEMAASGAQVMHPRAVEIGARFDMPIRVLSSFRDDGDAGTLITRRTVAMGTFEGLVLTGLASEKGHAQMVLRGLPRGMDAMTTVLEKLAAAAISVDMVTHCDTPDGRRQLQVSVREDSLAEARTVCEEMQHRFGASSLDVQTGLARVALVGSGMHNSPGVYAQAYTALREAGVDVYASSASAISIALLVRATDEGQALVALHGAFEFVEEAG
jgi:aspartate kinase